MDARLGQLAWRVYVVINHGENQILGKIRIEKFVKSINLLKFLKIDLLILKNKVLVFENQGSRGQEGAFGGDLLFLHLLQ